MVGLGVRLRELMRDIASDEIARRYLVLNGFDGALTTLGIVMGAYFAGVAQARIILSAALGASLAMGVSGAWGAYMAERAERTRSIKELEKALFASLDNSAIKRASQEAIVSIAFIDALAPVTSAAASLAPLILSDFGLLPLGVAVILALVVNTTILFLLGAFLGRISEASIWVHGGLMVLAGLFIVAVVYAIGMRF